MVPAALSSFVRRTNFDYTITCATNWHRRRLTPRHRFHFCFWKYFFLFLLRWVNRSNSREQREKESDSERREAEAMAVPCVHVCAIAPRPCARDLVRTQFSHCFDSQTNLDQQTMNDNSLLASTEPKPTNVSNWKLFSLDSVELPNKKSIRQMSRKFLLIFAFLKAI